MGYTLPSSSTSNSIFLCPASNGKVHFVIYCTTNKSFFLLLSFPSIHCEAFFFPFFSLLSFNFRFACSLCIVCVDPIECTRKIDVITHILSFVLLLPRYEHFRFIFSGNLTNWNTQEILHSVALFMWMMKMDVWRKWSD